jgi:hypothetical protein
MPRTTALLAAFSLAGPPAAAPSVPAQEPAPAPAPAAEGPRAQVRILLLPRGAGAELPPATDAALRESIRDGLRRGGAALIDPLAAGDLATCAADCLTRLRATLGVRYVVRATLAGVDRDYTLRLDLIDTRGGATTGSHEDRCELCGLGEARARLADGAARLLAPLQARPAAPTMLSITSDPPGAQILLDGLPVGRAPFERAVAAGEHRVRATLDGRVPAEAAAVAVEGERVPLHLALAPAPAPARRGPAIALLALGAPLAAASVPLLVLDDAYRPRGCADDCTHQLDTTWPAAALLASGAVLTTIGAVLLHQARRRARRPPVPADR